MSRSVKKVAGWCDRNPYAKNQANRRLRNINIKLDVDFENTNDEVPAFGKFKKYSEQWDICDWRSLYFSEREIEAYLDRWIYYKVYYRPGLDKDKDVLRARHKKKFYAK